MSRAITRSSKKINISFGFPSQGHMKSKNKTVGEHWSGFTEGSFISLHPLLGKDTVNMMAVLLHEMIHATSPNGWYRSRFSKTAKKSWSCW